MRNLRLVGLATLSLLLTAQVQVPKKDERLVIMVDREKGATVYRVNSALVPFLRLGKVLDDAVDQKGPDRPVFVLFHEETPLRVLNDLGSALGKRGFERVSFYYFDAAKYAMRQVEFEWAEKMLQFSPSGPPEPGQEIRIRPPSGPPTPPPAPRP